MKNLFLLAVTIFFLLNFNFVYGQFSGGKGTADKPFLISNLKDLKTLSENNIYWDKHFKQTKNIEASKTKNWNGDKGFSPIGNIENPFTGKYDGGKYKISNLFINRPTEQNIGFWGFLGSESRIINLRLENIKIKGKIFVGGIAGGSLGNIGGHTLSIIGNSYSKGNVSGESIVGGLVGLNLKCAVDNSYSTGNVNGTDCIGGLVGMNELAGKVRNCYSTCKVNGEDCVGGLVGLNVHLSGIYNSYSTGFVSGVENVGGLVGDNTEGRIHNSYWDKETSGQKKSSGGKGKTSTEMKKKASFLGWDFTNIWAIKKNHNFGYPYLPQKNNYILPVE